MNISVAGVARRGDRYLVMRRLPGGSVGGLWEFPGGKVDEGETPEQALRREWSEETDLSVQAGAEITRGAFEHRGRSFELIAFEVILPENSGDPVLREHDRWKWANLDEIGALSIVDSDRVVLKALLANRR